VRLALFRVIISPALASLSNGHHLEVRFQGIQEKKKNIESKKDSFWGTDGAGRPIGFPRGFFFTGNARQLGIGEFA